MNRLFLILLPIFAALAAEPLCAQSLAVFKQRLADSSAPVVPVAAGDTTARKAAVAVPGHARVSVVEYGDAEQAVAQASRQQARLRVRGYRVCIYMDNGQSGQDARAGAVAAKTQFEENYPGVPVHMVYENPYFKVRVGNCLTAEEAIILKGKISGMFPKAFLTREEFSLADLTD